MAIKPLNIAMISHYLPSGSKIGAGYQAHYMANALAKRGHRVTVFSLCPPTDGALYQTKTIDAGRRFRTFRFAWALRRIDFSTFDLLHAHGDDYWLFKPLTRAAIPHIRTMHGSCFAEAAHIPGLFDKLRMFLLGASEILSTLVADRTVAVSRNTTRYYPWVRDVIFNGVDLAAFSPPADGQRERTPTILFVGTYHNRKRGHLLQKFFSEVVRPAMPEAQLWMVSESAPAAPGVTVFGRISLERLGELYRRAWVFCLPSSYEGFGVPYIEAMASGTPVVATPNVGAIEVLEQGRFGLLVDPKELGVSLLELLNDREKQRRLSELGLQRVRDFAWERVTEAYEEIYRQALSRTPAVARFQDKSTVVERSANVVETPNGVNSSGATA